MSLLRASLAWAALVWPACAAEVTDIPEIGAHQPILFVEKNVHPQNRMVVYTKLDAQGRFLANPSAPERPLVDFYWLMDGSHYKPVNALIKGEIRRRFTGQWLGKERADRFIVKVNDLKEVNCDIPDPQMEIVAQGSGPGPSVEAEMKLGPSDGGMRIRLTSIYTEGRAFPPAVESVTLRGEEIVDGRLTGKKVARTYYAAGHSE